MKGFLVGAIAGGLLVWFWQDRLRGALEGSTRDARMRTADRLETFQQTAEGLLDATKERIRRGVRAGQETIRPSASEPAGSAHAHR
jgi:hypothetical protein